MNRILIGIGAGLIVIAGGVFWYKRAHVPPPADSVASLPAPGQAAGTTAPPVQHPVTPPAPEAEPLPDLKDSDAPLGEELSRLLGAEAVAKYLIPDMVVRRFVASVDNLPRRKLADRLRPVRPVEGPFAVTRVGSLGEETITLDPSNYARYDALVKLLQGVDVQQVSATYRRFYPLFQQQYEELGFPDQYFNDRVVAVIDHLLQTPEVSEPIALTQPNVFYEFADASLEARSAGQKALLRMGPQNAAVVKAKLQALRAAIAARPAAP